MRINRRLASVKSIGQTSAFLVLLAFFGAVLLGCGGKQPTKSPALEETISIAEDAYIYGYPLVTMDMVTGASRP